MKRRFIVSTMMLLLVLVLISTVSGSSELRFTSVGNKLLPLNPEDMPYESGGRIYVPYTVFEPALANDADHVGTRAYYTASTQTVTISMEGKELYFELGTRRTYDNQGTAPYEYSYAISHNGKAYVPVDFVCGFFFNEGLRYSVITDTGLLPIIRISGSESMSDSEFSNAAYIKMQIFYNDYLKNAENTPSAAPSAVVNTPSPTPDKTNIRISLTFTGVSLEVLDVLGDTPALFYINAQEVCDNADIVRRAVGTGKRIGLVESDYDGYSAKQWLREIAECVPDVIITEIPEVTTTLKAIASLAKLEENSETIFNLAIDDMDGVRELIEVLQNDKYNII